MSQIKINEQEMKRLQPFLLLSFSHYGDKALLTLKKKPTLLFNTDVWQVRAGMFALLFSIQTREKSELLVASREHLIL